MQSLNTRFGLALVDSQDRLKVLLPLSLRFFKASLPCGEPGLRACVSPNTVFRCSSGLEKAYLDILSRYSLGFLHQTESSPPTTSSSVPPSSLTCWPRFSASLASCLVRLFFASSTAFVWCVLHNPSKWIFSRHIPDQQLASAVPLDTCLHLYQLQVF